MDELGWSDELTDLSSSDHDSDDAPAIPAAASTRNARLSTRTQKAPYTIREQLRPYRNTQYTAESLYRARAFFSYICSRARAETGAQSNCLMAASTWIRTINAVCAVAIGSFAAGTFDGVLGFRARVR